MAQLFERPVQLSFGRWTAEIVRVSLAITILAALVGCSAAAPSRWRIDDRAGLGIEFYDRPNGELVAEVVAPPGPSVVPIQIEGDHWQVETPAGERYWLHSTEFPVPVIPGVLAWWHDVRVTEAFHLSSDHFDDLLSISISTDLTEAGLYSRHAARQAARVWALYQPFAETTGRVWVTFGGRKNADAPIYCSQGALIGYGSFSRRLCAYRSGSGWTELGSCRPDDVDDT